MTENLPDKSSHDVTDQNLSELELSDADILDAMQHIPGYLDISTEDFQLIYHLAHRHALERVFTGMSARRLMRHGIKPLSPDTTLDMAAKLLADSGYKGLPVVDTSQLVIGMLTETDFLRHLKVDSFLGLLVRMFGDSFELAHRCHEMTVGEAMTKPAVTIREGDGFVEIMESFHRHGGRSMPVVSTDGKLIGLLLRKDFVAAYTLKTAS